MSQKNKESLDKLLLFISDICEQDENAWFRKELQNNLSKFEATYSNSEQFDKIEKYLKLDGLKVIDYSNIKNENVRNQLFRDCIEMSKYRLGKINDTINFDEFCRYAYLQIEELINYYYNVKFSSDISEIQELISKHNKKFIKRENIDLNSISSLYKTLAFLKEYELHKKPMKRTIDFLRKLRNDMSHRNSYIIKTEDIILSKASERKIDVSKSFYDFNSSTNENIELYNNGRFIYLKRKEDYQEIMDCLNYLKEAIVIVLK